MTLQKNAILLLIIIFIILLLQALQLQTLNVLAFSTICLYLCRSCMQSFQLYVLMVFRSFLTSFSHLVWGLPNNLIALSFHSYTFLLCRYHVAYRLRTRHAVQLLSVTKTGVRVSPPPPPPLHKVDLSNYRQRCFQTVTSYADVWSCISVDTGVWSLVILRILCKTGFSHRFLLRYIYLFSSELRACRFPKCIFALGPEIS
jgi:predicted membrane protein